MIVLAKHPYATFYVIRELEQAGISPVRALDPEPGVRREVQSMVDGSLNGIHFYRSWRYWITNAKIPYHIAMELYQHPIGKKDIRAAGSGIGPAPDEQSERGKYPWLTFIHPETGQIVAYMEDKADWERLIAAGHLTQQQMDRYIFMDEKPPFEWAHVDGYHIDSQTGLNFMAKTIQKYDIHQLSVPKLAAGTEYDWLRSAALLDPNYGILDRYPEIKELVRSFFRIWMRTDLNGCLNSTGSIVKLIPKKRNAKLLRLWAFP